MSKDTIQALAAEKYPDVENASDKFALYEQYVHAQSKRRAERAAFIAGAQLAIDTNPLVKKYKHYVDNIEWHIKTNKPTGEDLRKCEEALKNWKEVLRDLTTNVQVVQPAKTDGGEQNIWESIYDTLNELIKEGFPRFGLPENEHSKNELIDKLKESFIGTLTLQPDSVKGTPVWVKASEKMPDKIGRYVVKRLGESMMADARLDKNDKMYFATPNGMQWNGWKNFQWLDESAGADNGREAKEFAIWTSEQGWSKATGQDWWSCPFSQNTQTPTKDELYGEYLKDKTS